MGVKAWSDEDTEKLVHMYQNETEDVFEIAEYFDKRYRSVISKLVNLGIYKKPEKDENNGKTVKTMLRQLEETLEIEIEGMNLNKKSNLARIVDALENKLGE